MTTLVETSEEEPTLAVARTIAGLAWYEGGLDVDEKAVLKHFDWPESKADAMREAAFGYQDLAKVYKFEDRPEVIWRTLVTKWKQLGLCCAGHDSTIHFVTDVGPTPRARSLSLRHLPLRDGVLQLAIWLYFTFLRFFLSDLSVSRAARFCSYEIQDWLLEGLIATPCCLDATVLWEFITFLDEVKPPAEAKTDSMTKLANEKNMLAAQVKKLMMDFPKVCILKKRLVRQTYDMIEEIANREYIEAHRDLQDVILEDFVAPIY